MDPKLFFNAVRRDPFGGTVNQEQVDGINAIVSRWDDSDCRDPRWLAYMLATAFHETARTMQPIKEYGGYAYYMRMYDKTGARPEVARALGNTHVGDGARFCGRGYVQLTGRANYEKAAAMLGVDFVGIPELAMEPGNAALILLLGMSEGWFTGRTLSDYLTGSKSDWEGARRIVNGLDRASTIAGYAKAFHAALLAAEAGPSDNGIGSAEPDKPPDPIVHSQSTEQPPSGGFFHALIRLLCRFFGRR